MALGLGSSGMCSAAQHVLLWEDPTQHRAGQRRPSGQSAAESWGVSASHPLLQLCSFSSLALGMGLQPQIKCGLSNPCLLFYSQELSIVHSSETPGTNRTLHE